MKAYRNLLSRILDQAIIDFYSHDKKNAKDARVWFYSRSEEDFSFLYCCSYLKIPPERVFNILKSRDLYKQYRKFDKGIVFYKKKVV